MRRPAYLVNGFGAYAGGIVRVHNEICRQLAARGLLFIASAPRHQESGFPSTILSRQTDSRRASLVADLKASLRRGPRYDVRVDSAPAFRLFTKSSRHVVVVHDLNFLQRHVHGISAVQYVYRWVLHHWTLRRVDSIVVNSEATAAEVRQFRPALERKVVVLPLPVDHVVAPRAPAASAGGEAITLMSFGHAANKGVEHLLELAAARPTVELLLICGQGHWRELWEPRARELGVTGRVHVRSSVSDSELYEAYCHADVFCMLSSYEGYGLPVAEALRLARPTIVSTLPVLAATSRHAAVVVDPADVVALSAAVDEALQAPRQRWLDAAETFRSWTWESWTTELLRSVA